MLAKTFTAHSVCLLFLLLMGFSCKKTVDKVKEDAAQNYASGTTWLITKFTIDATDISQEYAGWEMKMGDGGICTATSGSTVYTGTWSSSNLLAGFTCQFPQTNPAFILRLNGNWTTTSGSVSKVSFTQAVNGKNYGMELTKK